MKNLVVYIKNGIRALAFKIRYGNRIHIGYIQSFERIRIEMGKNASLVIGNYNQSREKLYLGVIGKGKLTLGNHCFFNINSSITCVESITIGDNCKFGNNLVIVDHDHNFKPSENFTATNPEFISSPISIGNNVWVGADVVILRGALIGDKCVIAAGSIVRGIVPDGTIFVQKRATELKEGSIGNV